jgi:hypothetical protein
MNIEQHSPASLDILSEWVSEWVSDCCLTATQKQIQLYNGEIKLMVPWNDNEVRFVLDEHS